MNKKYDKITSKIFDAIWTKARVCLKHLNRMLLKIKDMILSLKYISSNTFQDIPIGLLLGFGVTMGLQWNK